MSYDLFFAPETSNTEELNQFFSQRDNYQLHDEGAAYENSSTGVYFSFHYGSDDAEETVAFNLNYFRPSFFGLEAAIELTAFAEHFNFAVHDPQNNGMGDGPFSRDGFLSGWTAGNSFAYGAMLSMPDPQPVHTFPRSGLEAAWAWNYTCKQRLEEMVDEVFLPRIMFMKDGGNAVSVAVWPEAIPIHLPVTSRVLLGRSRGEERDFACAGWDQVQPLLEKHFQRNESPAPHYAVEYKLLPTPIARLFGSLPPFEMNASMGLSYDNVHAEEDVHQS